MQCRDILAALALITVVLPAGCADTRSTLQPTPSPVMSALPWFSLSGHVVDTANRPLDGASVRIVAGPGSGTATTTDETGGFAMPGTFTDRVTVTASKDGYASDTRTIPPPNIPPPQLVEGGGWELMFHLAPLGPPAEIAGVYTLTLTADNACTSLPAQLRNRTYTATIDPNGRNRFSAKLSDARFHSIPCSPGRPPETCTFDRIGIGLAGDYASIGVGIIEELGESGFLTFQAGAAGPFGPTGISAPLGGEVFYCPTEPVLIDQGTWWCPADTGIACNTHQFELTRR